MRDENQQIEEKKFFCFSSKRELKAENKQNKWKQEDKD